MVNFRRLFKIGFAVMLGVLVWMSIGITLASAHAELVSSNPVDDSTVQGPVTDLLLNFNEDVKHISNMKVQNNHRRLYKVSSYSYNKKQVMIHLADPLNNGTYNLSWTALGTDGHETPGALMFTVGKGSNSVSSAKPQTAKTAASKHSNYVVTVWLGVLLVLIIVGFIVMLRKSNEK